MILADSRSSGMETSWGTGKKSQLSNGDWGGKGGRVPPLCWTRVRMLLFRGVIYIVPFVFLVGEREWFGSRTVLRLERSKRKVDTFIACRI